MHYIYTLKFHYAKLIILLILFFCNVLSYSQTNLSVSACNSYLLPWNTVPTTTSGLYTRTYSKAPLPDSVVNITLTINNGPTSSTLSSSVSSSVTNIIDEQFDILNPAVTYTPTNWFQTNKSAPVGASSWFSGPFLSNGTQSFSPQSGAGCIVADYLNTNGNGTISNWLISPNVTIENGDVLSFYTIQNPSTPYADRLEVRLSTNGASTNVGTSATTVGDFTANLLTINNSLASYGYPQAWTQYTLAISGLSAPTSARIAFRYFVTSGGPLGANSDMIGLDNIKLSRTSLPSICAGNNLQLNINSVGGVSPYTVVISNNVVNSTNSSYVNGANISKSPIVNTTYSLVSVADANGCTASVLSGMASVIVKQPITMSFSASQCLQYVLPWGTTAYTSGIYAQTYLRANGCDSIISYNVTITNPSNTNLSVSACTQYSLPWSSTPVIVSGIYTNTYQNQALCDSNVSINVTIKLPVSTYTSVSSCINYTLPWGGIVDANGLYTYAYLGSNLCDSISNITLTILPISNTTNSVVACNNYILPWSTIPVTASGTYSYNYFNSAGCDSISNLLVMINNTVSTTVSVSACTSYILPWQIVATSASGNYSHTYVGSNNCDSTSTIVLVIHNIVNTSIADSAFNSYSLPWGIIANASGIFSNNYSNQFGCDSLVTFSIYIRPPLQLNLKVLLSGPYKASSNLMQDSLRVLGLIPNSDPYKTSVYNSSFISVNNIPTQIVGTGVFAISGNNAIVDWVFVQLRSQLDSSVVIATKAALVQRDGDVVSEVNGTSPISFSNLLPGQYFISIRHRNHLGVMTKFKQAIGLTSVDLDFTNPNLALFQFTSKSGNPSPLSGATRIQNGLRTLYGGNIEIALTLMAHKFITYNNWTLSDRAALLSATGGVSTINGYSIFDADMNGYARFNGLNPDRLLILQNCANLNNLIVNEQLP